MARESMKMMGLVEASYWLSWLTYYVCVILLITFGAVFVLRINVFTNSDPILLYMFLSMFGISTFSFIILIQSLF